MSKDLNLCQFIGRLGQDPEIRYMPNGDAVANISIAVGDDYKDSNGQKVEKTEWVRVTAFRGLAGIIGKYLTKGSKIYISGKLRTRKYQDQSGQDRYSTEIVASEMQMLDSRTESAGGGGQSRPSMNGDGGHRADGPPQSGGGDFDEDIPFNRLGPEYFV